MARLDGAEILARALKNEGVEKVFTLSGGHIFRVYQECDKLGIDIIGTRHEGAAAFAAQHYALTSGKPGVVLLTAGPGVTNAMTQVAECSMGDVPVLFLGGAAALFHELTAALQEYDTLGMMKPHTVFASKVKETHRIAEHIAVAFRSMLGAKTGPAYIELPVDILEVHLVEEETVKFPENYRAKGRILGDPADVEKAADLLINAEKPMIWVGDGAQFNCQNYTVFKELAEYLQIPADFSNSNLGRFVTHNEDPLFQVGALAMTQADVITLLNYRPILMIAEQFPDDCKLINVNRNGDHVGLNFPVEVGMIGHADAVAEQILKAVKSKTAKRDSSEWVDSLVSMRSAFAPMALDGYDSDESPIRAVRLAYDIFTFLQSPEGQEFCYIFDGGDSVTWPSIIRSFRPLQLDFPGIFYIASYKGAVGNSMGAVTGVYKSEGRPIIHSIGDGSFGQYTAELFTYAQKKIPYVVVIFNDANWGMIKAFSMIKAPDENHDIGQLINLDEGDGYFRYEKIADAWGGYGVCVTQPEDIIPEIKKAAEACKSGKPAIVNCLVACKKEYFSMQTNSLYQHVVTPPKLGY